MQSVEKNGIYMYLDADSHDDMLKIVEKEKCIRRALKKHPPDSFQYVFW